MALWLGNPIATASRHGLTVMSPNVGLSTPEWRRGDKPQLFLSVRTVETHRAHVQQKLGRSTWAELVRYALDHDLLGDD